MKIKKIALVKGDGIGPETMTVCCPIIEKAAAKHDLLKIEWVEAPMGWSAFDDPNLRDTFPESSLQTALECGIVYFGAVGDKVRDDTDGEKYPGMKPETKALLGLREGLDLLINWRPIVVPDQGINQLWGRFALEDGYMGKRFIDAWLKVTGIPDVPDDLAQRVVRHLFDMYGVKHKQDVTTDDHTITEFSYFTRRNIERYARYMLAYAQTHGLPVTNVHKANILARSLFWQKVIREIQEEEYPDVEMTDLFVDAGVARLVARTFPNGIILAGNEHGDIGTDGAGAYESLGTMRSATINPDDNSKGLFESGAGTACDIAGKGIANPIGRLGAGSEMLRHIGATKSADNVDRAIRETLDEGWRTQDIAKAGDGPEMVVNTEGMAEQIILRI